jgi:NAD(P)-dependent dehydrogenase (short-subunit alcohol dehydrogenase family)
MWCVRRALLRAVGFGGHADLEGLTGIGVDERQGHTAVLKMCVAPLRQRCGWRAFAPILAANGGGAIVNMHSVLSWLAGSGACGASKAAIWSITNSPRAELKSQNTQVVGVHAGLIDSEMAAGYRCRN